MCIEHSVRQISSYRLLYIKSYQINKVMQVNVRPCKLSRLWPEWGLYDQMFQVLSGFQLQHFKQYEDFQQHNQGDQRKQHYNNQVLKILCINAHKIGSGQHHTVIEQVGFQQYYQLRLINVAMEIYIVFANDGKVYKSKE